MKNIVDKVKNQLSTKRLTMGSIVQEVLRKSDPEFGDDQELKNIVALLKRDPATRTQLDVDKIRLSFFRFKFFQELEQQMGADMVQNLYKQLGYEIAKCRQTIFNIGDIGKKFYIILKGSVWVLVQKKGLQEEQGVTEEEQQQEEKLRKEKKKSLKQTLRRKSRQLKTQSSFLTSQQFTDEDIYNNLTDEEYLELQFPTLVRVGILHSGESFGEIALTKAVPRTATIVASEDTHFATVTRDQFNKLLSFHYEYQQKLNIGFLSKVSIFSEWNEQMLNQLYYHFKIEEGKLFQIIYKEDDDCNFIYLLKSGEIELSRLIEVSSKQDVSNLTLQKFFTKTEKKTERVRTSIITPGQIFGHEEIFAEIPRQERAMCISQRVSFFVLDKSRFLQYFQKGDAILKLQKLDAQKLSQREHSLNFMKQIKTIKPIIPQRKIPVINEEIKSASQRIGNPQLQTGYQLLQGHGHVNKAHYNFKRNINLIKNNMKESEPLSLQKALFQVESTKGSTISIMSKIFPGAVRPKYEIPDCSISNSTLIKFLKLPKILTDVDNVMMNRTNKHYLNSFKTNSLNTLYNNDVIHQQQDQDDSQL